MQFCVERQQQERLIVSLWIIGLADALQNQALVEFGGELVTFS